jgi:hypothetical protein
MNVLNLKGDPMKQSGRSAAMQNEVSNRLQGQILNLLQPYSGLASACRGERLTRFYE